MTYSIFNLFFKFSIGFGFLQFLLPAIGALAGGLANRSSTANQKSSFNTTQTNTPNILEPETSNLKNLLTANYTNMIPGGAGYQNYQLRLL